MAWDKKGLASPIKAEELWLVTESALGFPSKNAGDRRLGIDRRQFLYDGHIPERRSGEERRSGKDRRGKEDRRSGLERRNGMDRRQSVKTNM